MTLTPEDFQRILASLDPAVVARGRAYAVRGRVSDVASVDGVVTATVNGTEPYDVEVGVRRGRPFTECTCPAHANYGECKHVAALALHVQAEQELGDRPRDPTKGPLPPLFGEAYSARHFFVGLGLYDGEPVEETTYGHRTLTDWWWHSLHPDSPRARRIRERIFAATPEVEQVLGELARFEPPECVAPGTAYAALYAALAERYRRLRGLPTTVQRTLPGPLDDRHPGFDLGFDEERRFTLTERRPEKVISVTLDDAPRRRTGGRRPRSAETLEPRSLSVTLPREPGAAPKFPFGVLDPRPPLDAWDLFALRAALLALARAEDPVCRALLDDLGRPLWQHALAEVTPPERARGRDRLEWAFSLDCGFERREIDLRVFSRPAREPGREVRWRKSSLDALLAADAAQLEDASGEAALLRLTERAIARATNGLPWIPSRSETKLTIPSGHGYELLRLLARHPRVTLRAGIRPQPDTDPTPRILAGKMTMRLEPAPGGGFAPRFYVADEPFPFPLGLLELTGSSVFQGVCHAPSATIVAAEISPELRHWFSTVQRMGDALEFPGSAADEVTAATMPLVSAGLVELPVELLGEERPHTPVVGLRVSWLVGGDPPLAADVELMIRVAPRAPLVIPGEGARLFTFEDRGRRAFVTRDRAIEPPLAEAVQAVLASEVPIAWAGPCRGGTRGVAATFALAAWLERNPLGLPIEVKRGRPPQRFGVGKGAIVVTRTESFLRVKGNLEVGDDRITVGAILDAARLANRFVPAASGVFLELSEEALAKLRPLALAAALAPPRLPPGSGAARLAPEETDEVILHEGFAPILHAATGLFATVESPGIDLDEVARRLTAEDSRIEVPPLDNGELRPYQREGVRWMLRLAAWAPGCLLADDMGLGKTIQTAAVLKARAALGPALVVAPASVASNWVAELGRFVSSLEVRWFNADRSQPPASVGPGQVLVVSYGLLQRQRAQFAEHRWATVVVDEAQYVKTLGTQRSEAVRGLDRSFTIALTGTPLENHLGELFSIVDIAFPGLLGTEAGFREVFQRPIEARGDSDALAFLSRLVAPFLLRRTRAAVLTELPPRQEVTELLELSPEESDRYVALREAVERELADYRRAKAERRERSTPAQLRIILLAALTRLRQLACDVRLLDASWDGSRTKLARVVELATQIASEGNRLLVFSVFTTFLGMVRDALSSAGLRVASLTGETPTTARPELIEAFQAGDYDVFCISLHAGGTGLNLTRASYVVHLDPWWNPAVEEQATARAHRMGQTEPVTVYRLIARGTVEQAVLDLHERKRDLAAAVLEGKGEASVVTAEELLDLLRFGAA